jgi:hypothetical protein
MSHFLLTVTFLLSGLISMAQSRTISGSISNEETGELLFGVVVYDTVSKKGSVTNEYGYYSITLANTTAVLRFSNPGFKTRFVAVPAEQNLLNIAMKSTEMLDEVEILGKRAVTSSEMGTMELSLDKINKLPIILGERDVFRVLQLLPGVKSGGEASSGLYVRGGGPDQNLILLDGVPVYNASHLFGFFSTFNSDAISGVTLHKGGFPSRYGGRASSVIDMRMKEGNTKHYNLEGSIGIIASRLLLEGPIIKDKTSFIVSARRTYIDVLTQPIIYAIEKQSAGYFFEDFNAKIQHKINDKHHLYLSGYFGKDKFYLKWKEKTAFEQFATKSKLQWGNSIGAIRWNYKIHPKLFMNTTGTFSRYQFLIGYKQTSKTNWGTDETSFDYNSGILDWSLKSDLTYFPNPNHTIRFGLGDTYHTFTPGISYSKQSSTDEHSETKSGSPIQYSHETQVYVEDDMKLGSRIKINVGIHHSSFFSNGTWYHAPQPRLAGNYQLTKKSSLKFGGSRMAQFMHLLSNSTIGLPTDLWVPATNRTKPVYSNQFNLGYYLELPKNFQFSVEGYYKHLSHVIQYKEGVSFIAGGTDWQEKITTGQGWSYGSEFLLEKKTGKFTGWIGYTLSWTERQFDDINDGKRFFYKYDRRHDLSIALTYDPDPTRAGWDFGLVFVFSTGNMITLPTHYYNSAPNPTDYQQSLFTELQSYEKINNFRIPSYHRLDLGANKTKERRAGTSTWSFSIYNVYNRQNPFMIYAGYNKSSQKALMQISLFPIIPSISWKFQFNLQKLKEARQHEKK